MPGSASVLLLEGFDVSLAPLAARLRRLGLRTLAARTPEEALALSQRQTVGAVVLPSDLPPREAAGFVAALRSGAAQRSGAALRSGAAERIPGLLAAGPEPPRGDGRDALREAGIGLALWEPFDDAWLRYQLNRALAPAERQRPRCALRVPCSVPARAVSRANEKPGRLYTLSEHGLFFETPRASMRGAEVSLELRIGGHTLPARGRVAVANVPGNLHNPKLPVGIGVQFTDLGEASLRAIRHAVAALAPSLAV
jgi:hypothetical protein